MASGAAEVDIWAYIQKVKYYIELCITKYMTKDQTMQLLWGAAHIPHCATAVLWGRLEQDNPEFFSAYALRLALIQQISTFNFLLIRQADLMSRAYGNSMMGFPLVRQPPIFNQSFPSSSHGQLAPFSSMVPSSGIPLPKNSRPSYLNRAVSDSSHMINMNAPNCMISDHNSNIAYGFSDGSFMHQNYPNNFSNGNIPQLDTCPDVLSYVPPATLPAISIHFCHMGRFPLSPTLYP